MPIRWILFLLAFLVPSGAFASPTLIRGTITAGAVHDQQGGTVRHATLGGLAMDRTQADSMVLIQGFWFPLRYPSAAPINDLDFRSGWERSFPNPIRSSGVLWFVIGVHRESEQVSLTVYDVQGRLVRTILNGPVPAGRHSALWDGRNDEGVTLPSGVYYARLTIGRFVAHKQLVLVK
jgi:hypothetical protein